MRRLVAIMFPLLLAACADQPPPAAGGEGAAAAPAPASVPEEGLPAGSLRTGSLRIGTRIAPLPPGFWLVAASSRETFRTRTGTPYPVSRVTLVQERGGRVAGVVGIAATRPLGTTLVSFGPPQTCSTTGVYLRETVRAGSDSHDCYAVTPFAPGRRLARDQPAEKVNWAAIAARGRGRPGYPPGLLACTFYSLFDPNGWLELTYCWSPEEFGTPADNRPWAQNAYNPDRLGGPQREFVDRLVEWSRTTHPVVARGFGGQAAGPTPGL